MRRKRARTEDSAVSGVFERVFEFDVDSSWSLPGDGQLFVSAEWQCDDLYQLSQQLNKVRSQLSDKPAESWGRHTNSTSLAGAILPRVVRLRPELLTQAWCKFYELLAVHRVVDDLPCGRPLVSLHLCEAPGAFVAALNHYCCSEGRPPPDWHANTLNPHHELGQPGELIADDRLMVSGECRRRWLFGPDDRGDLRSRDTGVQMTASVRGGCDLVTADGSVDCSRQPELQETTVIDLLYCEVLCALSALSPCTESISGEPNHGVLVLKMFTFFSSRSVCLLFLLATSFRRIRMVKPSCSKAGNSEVYVICTGRRWNRPCVSAASRLWQHYNEYSACQTVMIGRSDIPEKFLKQVIECARFFAHSQMEEIERNIWLFECAANDTAEFTRQMEVVETLRNLVANRYMRLCRVERVHCSRFISPPASASVSCWWSSRCKSTILLDASSSRAKLRAALDSLSDILHVSDRRDGLVFSGSDVTTDFRQHSNLTMARCSSVDLCTVCRHSLFCHPTLLAAFNAALGRVTGERSVENADCAVLACFTPANSTQVPATAISDSIRHSAVQSIVLDHLVPRLLKASDVACILEAWQRYTGSNDISDSEQLVAGDYNCVDCGGHDGTGESHGGIGVLTGDRYSVAGGFHDLTSEDHGCLLISGLSLLHRLNVSVLLVLSSLCRRVVFLPPETSHPPLHELWRVRLEGLTYTANVRQVFDDMLRILNNPPGQVDVGDESEGNQGKEPRTKEVNWTVLSLLPVTTLIRDSEFFGAVQKYNNASLAPLVKALLDRAEQP